CLSHGKVLPFFQAIPDVALWPMEFGTKTRMMGSGRFARLADMGSLIPLVWSVIGLAWRCRRVGIQLIHTSDKKRAVIFTTLLHRLTGIPFVYHIHNNYVDYPANRAALRMAAVIVANSEDMKQDFVRERGDDLDRIQVVYNGLNADEFAPGLPSNLRSELGVRPDQILIGVVSRLAPDKGQETFVRAAARVAQDDRALFVLAGDDSILSDNVDYVPMLSRLVRELGLESRTHFLGCRNDMANVYCGLDVVVDAAWREAFGMVVVEAQACGKPVVGTRSGGIPEIITHGEDGFLFPVRDEVALADILTQLVRDPTLRARMGAAGRATVLRRFSIDAQVRAMEGVYRTAILRRSGSPPTAPSHDGAARVKTLLLDTNDAMGGVIRSHSTILRTLDRTRFDVHLACLGHGSLMPLFHAIPNVTIWPIEMGTKSKELCEGWRSQLADTASLLPLGLSAWRLARLCRGAGIQIIHTSDKKRAVHLALLVHRLTGIPFIYHIRDGYVDYPANRRALARAAAIVANSGDMRLDFIRALGPTMDRIRVIHNSVDTEEFAPGKPSLLRQELDVSPETVLIGTTCRLSPEKDQVTFLRAAARVAIQDKRAFFVIVGDDSISSHNAGYGAELKALARELGLESRVAFIGRRSDMPAICNGLDVVVDAALREAFGMVVVEAAACGKPVVGTCAGGIPEIITHGEDGFLFPVRDDAALAAILLDLVRDPALRARIGAAARTTVLKRFSAASQVRCIEQVYNEVAGIASSSSAISRSSP
ncbi:MAG: glycosyltransferase family 4 protein, partial [bacterium]